MQQDLGENFEDTRLPQSSAGGQEPYLRSPVHLGMSSKTKDRKNAKEVKKLCDGWTDNAGCTVIGQNVIGIFIIPLTLIQNTECNNQLLKLQPAVTNKMVYATTGC